MNKLELIQNKSLDANFIVIYGQNKIEYVNFFQGVNDDAVNQLSSFIDLKETRFTKIFKSLFYDFQQDLNPALEKAWELHCSLFLGLDEEYEPNLEKCANILDNVTLTGDNKTKLDQIRSSIEDLKDDIEEKDILENRYLVTHLPPLYDANQDTVDIKYFNIDNGFDEDDLEQVVNMFNGDRVDLEDIVIIRTK